MKIIHCADIHLGSKMDSRLPADKAEERRRELRASFLNLCEYAKSNGVRAILIAGDLFDSDRPLKKDKEFFYSAVKNNPEIDFLYLRGNHDGLQSYTEELDNLKCFSPQWTAYNYGNVCVSGLELTAENANSLYSTLHLDAEKINIVALHGQLAEGRGADKINLSRLRGKNIDYLALGHIHGYSFGKIDERGQYAYCGCLEGRGFDEAGDKGFILLDITDKVSAKFVPFAKRRVSVCGVDISDCADGYAVYRKVKGGLDCKKSDIVRVILRGETVLDGADIASETATRLQGEGYY